MPTSGRLGDQDALAARGKIGRHDIRSGRSALPLNIHQKFGGGQRMSRRTPGVDLLDETLAKSAFRWTWKAISANQTPTWSTWRREGIESIQTAPSDNRLYCKRGGGRNPTAAPPTATWVCQIGGRARARHNPNYAPSERNLFPMLQPTSYQLRLVTAEPHAPRGSCAADASGAAFATDAFFAQSAPHNHHVACLPVCCGHNTSERGCCATVSTIQALTRGVARWRARGRRPSDIHPHGVFRMCDALGPSENLAMRRSFRESKAINQTTCVRLDNAIPVCACVLMRPGRGEGGFSTSSMAPKHLSELWRLASQEECPACAMDCKCSQCDVGREISRHTQDIVHEGHDHRKKRWQ